MLIQAALRKTVDADKVAIKWLDYVAHKTVTPEQRLTAQNWVKLNVAVDNEMLSQVLNDVYGTGWAFGSADALADLNPNVGFDWDRWQAGNEAAAALLDPPAALQQMLANKNIVLKGISDTSIDRIGSALALSLSQGLGAGETAKAINYVINDPARALVIARTETSRALIQSNVSEYRAANIKQIEWIASDPCKICQQNANAIVPIGSTFPSGAESPPAHPNCICDLAPVSEFDNPIVQEANITEVAPESPALTRAQDIARTEFIPEKWVDLTKQETEEFITKQIMESPRWTTVSRVYGEDRARDLLLKDKKTLTFIKNGHIIKNGSVTVKVYNTKGLKPEVRTRILARIDALQSANPRDGMVVHLGGMQRKQAYGHAIAGDHDIRLSPTHTLTSDAQKPNPDSAGAFKMPSLNDVSQMEYTLTHEWGHAIEAKGGRITMGQFYKENKDLGFASRYAQSAPAEMYAELFAEWFNTNGKTDNLLVQRAAELFGWKA